MLEQYLHSVGIPFTYVYVHQASINTLHQYRKTLAY